MGQLACKITVIGQQQQAFTGPIEPAHWINACIHVLYEIHHGRAAFRVRNRGHIAFWFIEKKIDVPLCSPQQLAINFNVVSVGIGLAAKLSDCVPVHADAALRNHRMLVLSDITMLRDFGFVTLIDLTVSLAGVLLVLPAVLALAERDDLLAGVQERVRRAGAALPRRRRAKVA